MPIAQTCDGPLITVEDHSDYLVNLQTDLIAAINARAWDAGVWQCITAGFRALPPLANVHQDRPLGPDEYKRHLQAVCERFPACLIEILDISTDVHARSGLAHVFFTVKQTGMPLGITHVHSNVSTFEVMEERWRMIVYRGYEGMSSAEA